MATNTVRTVIASACIFAGSLLAASNVDAQGVRPPQPNSTGNPCYEACMRHYTEMSGLVSPRAASQCATQCSYGAPRRGGVNQACVARCRGGYDTCMRRSPNPQMDRNCPSSYLQCQNSCRGME